MENKSESYIISFDRLEGDSPTMCVSKYEGTTMKLVNVITGKQAEEMFDKLTNHKNEEEK